MITARFDCLGGASGNMLLGAMVDAGVDVAVLEAHLRRLPLPAWSFDITRVHRRGLAAVHIDVRYPEESVARHLPDIVHIIEAAALPSTVQRDAIAVFTRLADAEARVHGIARHEVHFHEVGAVDAIIDIVGVVTGLSMLGAEAVSFTPLPVGVGTIRCAHGELPNPPPATAELLRGVPIRETDVPGELVTPTGAALLTTLGRCTPSDASWVIERIGYGAGTRDSERIANVTRLMLVRAARSARPDTPPLETDTVMQIECVIDDMNPQIFGYVTELLLLRGALDAYLTPVQMKKGRPGTLLTVLCRPQDQDTMVATILGETTTLGVRVQPVERRVLPRVFHRVTTPWGDVRVKVAGGRAHPEHDDCRRLAEASGVALRDVIDRAREAASRGLMASDSTSCDERDVQA